MIHDWNDEQPSQIKNQESRIKNQESRIKNERVHRDFRKVMILFCATGKRALNAVITALASPPCRRIASLNVKVSPSCMSRSRVRRPHNGAVLSLFAVPWP